MPTPFKPVLSKITLIGVIMVGLVLVLPSACRFRSGHHPIGENVSNVRQIGYSLASFAMDNDGQFPTAATAELYELPPPTSSNDLFRQLFASNNTSSERIFWVRDSKTSKESLTTAVGAHFNCEHI